MYSWSFGDQTTGSGAKVDHNYTAGVYNVQLTVFDNNGNGDVMTQTVTIGSVVTNIPPKALFIATVNGLKVDVVATGSVDSDGTIVSYAWNWGYSTADGSGFSSTHTYVNAGTYNLSLTVTDDKGATGNYWQNVVLAATPSNLPPTASFTWSANQLTATFNAANSKDSDGTIVSYAWNFGDGSIGTGVNPSYAYKAAGSYNVILTVTDNAGAQASSSPQQVTVQAPTVNQAPICSIGSCNVWYLQVNCNSLSTDDAGITNYLWEWADGLTDTGASLQSIQHNYATPNTYIVKLTVRDAGGLSSVCSRSVVTTTQTTQNNPPISQFGFYADSLKYSFWFSGWDSDGTVASYLWNFGNGQTSTSNAPIYTYPAAGKYTVTLTVTDNGGAKGVSSQLITVVNTPKNFHV